MIIFVCGFARAGKTSIIDHSRFPKISTSEILTDFTARAYLELAAPQSSSTFSELKDFLTRKGTSVEQQTFARGLKILCAESIIVPTLGRQSLVNAAFCGLDSRASATLFESIGGEELLMAIDTAQKLGLSWKCINVRHKDEETGVDIRELAGTGTTSHLDPALISDFWRQEATKEVNAANFDQIVGFLTRSHFDWHTALKCSIRFFGWLGVVLTVLAIGLQNMPLLIISQAVGSVTAYLYNQFLMRRHSWDNHLALVVSVLAAVTRSEWLMFTAGVVRMVSYQLIFERINKNIR